MINVSVVEAHAVQRIGLKGLLESNPSISVVDVSTSLRNAKLQAVDVLLLSFCAVCDFPPVDLISSLAQENRLVLYSGKETSISLLAYQNTKARALLHQSDLEEKLFSSIRTAKAGTSDTVLRTEDSVCGLSPRETLVLALIGDGYTLDQIARRIGISKHTVDTYIRRIRTKLNLGNKAQLAKAAAHLAATWAGTPSLPTLEPSDLDP